jgi:hypothetical protein
MSGTSPAAAPGLFESERGRRPRLFAALRPGTTGFSLRSGRGRQAFRCAPAGDDRLFAALRPGTADAQFSRFTALSCHLRRARWLIQVVTRNSTMPVNEIMMSAANMRAILSW